MYIDPSNTDATNVQRTSMQRLFFKTIRILSCWYSLHS